jgi:nucleoside-diphosphate-sugar epimerase
VVTSHKVFVTGATGVLGRRVVPRLVEAGHTVTAVARSEEKAAALRTAGATPVFVDLFDRDAVRAAVAGHDSIAQLATHIPTGEAAADPSAWRINESLRREAAPAIAAAAGDAGVERFIQESITFPYIDRGDEWIDEQCERVSDRAPDATAIAEAAAAGFTAAGGVGIVLRFALFMAAESAHTQSFFKAAKRGVFALVGDPEAFISFVHMDDAAGAVLAALDAPPGTYNVAEPDPVRRDAHREMLAKVVGRSQLRPVQDPLEGSGVRTAASLGRSHRISSQHLRDVSSWVPAIHCVDCWKELR